MAYTIINQPQIEEWSSGPSRSPTVLTSEVSIARFLFIAASSSCKAAAWACLASAGGPIWLMMRCDGCIFGSRVAFERCWTQVRSMNVNRRMPNPSTCKATTRAGSKIHSASTNHEESRYSTRLVSAGVGASMSRTIMMGKLDDNSLREYHRPRNPLHSVKHMIHQCKSYT